MLAEETFVEELEMLSIEAVAHVNDNLMYGVKLPDEIFGFKSSGSMLDFNEGYVTLGLTPTNSFWQSIDAVLSAGKQALTEQSDTKRVMEAPISPV
jgi:hypothetical protein